MKTIKNKMNRTKLLAFFSIVSMVFLSACSSDDLDGQTFATDELALTASREEMVFEPSMFNEKFQFNWTTGNNMGTGSAIFYKLQLDKTENNFSNPVEYDFGKNVFSFELGIPTFNAMLLTTFGAQVGTPVSIQARIIATFANESVATQVSEISLVLTPYQPLTNTLFLVGSATPGGWDIANATPLIQAASNPTVFTYEGTLTTGNFKFAVSTDSCLCQDFYTRNADNENSIIHNIGGSGDDLQWTIESTGMYKLTVNLIELTILIEEVDAPPFTQLWIVGDASPSGWDINNPKPFTQTDNPFVFTYEATFVPGNFKILAGSTGDWCGQWYRPLVDNEVLTATTVEQNSGCDVDNKWQVTAATAGRYKITLNTANNTIKIVPVEVYLIGDATPNGWSMGSFTPMTKNGSVYTFTGNLTAGEFKFTKFNTNWCEGTEIVAATPNQSILNTSFLYRDNCAGDDNKWVVSAAQAGNRTIVINLDTNELTIN